MRGRDSVDPLFSLSVVELETASSSLLLAAPHERPIVRRVAARATNVEQDVEEAARKRLREAGNYIAELKGGMASV